MGFAGRSEAPPLQCFRHGYGCGDVSFRELLIGLLVQAGDIDKKTAGELADRFSKIASRYGLPQYSTCGHAIRHCGRDGEEKAPVRLGGQMLQLFIHRDIVDALVYRSHPYGVPYKTKVPVSEWLAGQNTDSTKNDKGIPESNVDGQVRIIFVPEIFANPSLARVYHYCGDWQFFGGSEDDEGSRARLAVEVREILSTILNGSSVAKARKQFG